VIANELWGVRWSLRWPMRWLDRWKTNIARRMLPRAEQLPPGVSQCSHLQRCLTFVCTRSTVNMLSHVDDASACCRTSLAGGL
jgi:hypothetical protein